MPRLFSRTLAFGLLALAGLSSALAEITSIRYLIPVSYDMVITRPGVSASSTKNGVTTETTTHSFEVFNNKDILKLILGVTTDAGIKDWSLYAVGVYSVTGDEIFPDPAGLETLELVARKKNDTEDATSLPTGMSFSLSLSSTRAYSSSAIRDNSATGEVLSKRDGIIQLATLTQTLPVRGDRPAGTLETTGYLSHGLIKNKVTIGKETTSTAVNFPTTAVYRAAGTFKTESPSSEDGLAEVLIAFGSPTFQSVATDAD